MNIEHLDNLTEELWYVAHPVHPTDAEIAEMIGPSGSDFWGVAAARVVRDNIANAKLWLAWLARRFPAITFIAPWIASLDGGGGDDLDPASRERGLRDCCRTIRACDGLVHTGGRVSSGMVTEARAARWVVDLTYLGRSPPDDERPAATAPATEIVDQPAPTPRPDQVPVWDLVIADMQAMVRGFDDHSRVRTVRLVLEDMRQRDKVGRERYGTPLTADNGRDHLVDLYQELLDASAYSKAEVVRSVTAEVRDVYDAILLQILLTRSLIDGRSRKAAK